MADTGPLRKRVESEISDLEERLATLRAHLKAIDTVDQLSRAFTESRPGKDVRQPDPQISADMTMVDGAAYALQRMGGEGHGMEILKLVEEVRPIGGQHKMTALSAAMKRDARFIKDRSRPNYWRLKTA